MKTKIMYALLIGVVCLSLIAASAPPCLFYGTVTGYPAGTIINVVRGGVVVASAPVVAVPGYGTMYSVFVPGALGDEVNGLFFRVGGNDIATSFNWRSGGVVSLNLPTPRPGRPYSAP